MVIALEPSNIVGAFQAFATLGYKPIVPITAAQFADADLSLEGELSPGVNLRFVSLETLIAMKAAAQRPRDVDDLEHLRWILKEQVTDER